MGRVSDFRFAIAYFRTLTPARLSVPKSAIPGGSGEGARHNLLFGVVRVRRSLAIHGVRHNNRQTFTMPPMAELNYQDGQQARRDLAADWRCRLFGVDYNDVWGALAREIGARHDAGGWWKYGKVVADVGAWQMTLDNHVVSNGKSAITYTRLRAPFVSRGGLRFLVYRRGVFSDLGKMLGMQDI